MNKNEKFVEEVKYLFNTHPNRDEFHFTSDGQAFFRIEDAEPHAKSLKDEAVENSDKVISVTREQFENNIEKTEEALKKAEKFKKEQQEKADAEAAEKEAAEKEAAEKEAAEKEAAEKEAAEKANSKGNKK